MPRARAWMFSSVVSGGCWTNSSRSIASKASIAGVMGTVSSRQPSRRAVSAASSTLSFEVNGEGIITACTRSGPSASVASAAASALSTPPESPISTPGKMFLFT